MQVKDLKKRLLLSQKQTYKYWINLRFVVSLRFCDLLKLTTFFLPLTLTHINLYFCIIKSFSLQIPVNRSVGLYLFWNNREQKLLTYFFLLLLTFNIHTIFCSFLINVSSIFILKPIKILHKLFKKY